MLDVLRVGAEDDVDHGLQHRRAKEISQSESAPQKMAVQLKLLHCPGFVRRNVITRRGPLCKQRRSRMHAQSKADALGGGGRDVNRPIWRQHWPSLQNRVE